MTAHTTALRSLRDVFRESKNPYRSWLTSWVALAALPPALVLAFIIISPAAGAIQRSLEYDALYYLQVATNVAHGHGSTFGGIVRTNGYQPLWLIVLIPIGLLSPGNSQMWADVLVSLLCSTVGVVLLARTVRRVHPAPVIIAGAVAAIISFAMAPLWAGGMETGLVIISVSGAVWQVVRNAPERWTPKDALAFSGWTALAFLARLDTLLVLGPLFAVVSLKVWRSNQPTRARMAANILFPVGGVVLLYLAINYALFGTPIPVSGRAKLLPGGGIRIGALYDYAGFPWIQNHNTYGAVFLSLIAVGVYWRLRRRNHAAVILPSLVAGFILIALFGAFTSPWARPLWYQFPIVLLIVALGWVFALEPISSRRLTVKLPAIAVALAVVYIGASQWHSYHLHRLTANDERVTVADSGAFLARRDPGAVVAIGDVADNFAYAHDLRVVNLEGLVEGPDYLSALRSGNILPYLAAGKVAYYARVGLKDGTAVAIPGRSSCTRWWEPRPSVVMNRKGASLITCDDQRVYVHPTDNAGVDVAIWRYEPGIQQQP